MNISRRIARCAVFGVTLGACAMLVQAQEKEQTSTGRTDRAPRRQAAPPARERSAPAPRERSAAPAAQERTAPAAQRSVPAPERRDQRPPAQMQRTERPVQPAQREAPQAQPQPQPQSRRDAPSQAPRTRQVQPDGIPADRPGRALGNQPAAQPGRTFGNRPPGRAPEPARGQTQTGARPAATPPRVFTTRTGDVIHRDSSGQLRQIRTTNGTMVYRPPNAPRRVEAIRPGGRVVVASAPGHGYVQRPVVIRNTTIIKRTYVYNGVPQARLYRPRVYHGVTLAVYTPVRYYRPSFYRYAYNPWSRPVTYAWGWGGSPWYGYYGGYFTPYPVYASPALWLTDYLIAATLQAAYEERMAARSIYVGSDFADGGQAVPMTPEVKQAIADEVRRQIDQERAEGQTSNFNSWQDDNIFADDAPHVFVSHASFLVDSNAGECAIGEGDVLRMNGAPSSNATSAELVVLSSRGSDCRQGSRVVVALEDLQEMHNQMMATVDRGLGDLQAKQGQGGLPNVPQGSAGTLDSPFAQEAQPDTNAASELTSVSQEGDRAEQQAISLTGEGAAPPTLSLGMSIAEVKAIQGEPQKIVDLGSKKIYVYSDLKITFSDGKVSDIQ